MIKRPQGKCFGSLPERDTDCSGVLLELSGKKAITRGAFCDSTGAGRRPVVVFCWSGQGLSEQDAGL